MNQNEWNSPLKKNKNFRNFIEIAYKNEKKGEKPQNWTPFVNKTFISMEKKVEKELKAEMERNSIIEEENTRFLQAEYRVFPCNFHEKLKEFIKKVQIFAGFSKNRKFEKKVRNP